LSTTDSQVVLMEILVLDQVILRSFDTGQKCLH